MKPDGLDTLAAVEAFLTETVLPGVAQQHRGETRAALKMLRAARAELDALPVVLGEELVELAGLCARADELLAIATHAPAPPAAPCSLSDLAAEHARASAAVCTAVLALQEHLRAQPGPGAARDLLGEIYEALERHAERRLPWQSVFAATTMSQPST